MHDTIGISPFPESSMCPFFNLQYPLITPLLILCFIKTPFENECLVSQPSKSIPCGFNFLDYSRCFFVKHSSFLAKFSISDNYLTQTFLYNSQKNPLLASLQLFLILSCCPPCHEYMIVLAAGPITLPMKLFPSAS